MTKRLLSIQPRASAVNATMSMPLKVAQDRTSMPYPEPLDEHGGGLGVRCATGTGLVRSRVQVDGIDPGGKILFHRGIRGPSPTLPGWLE
nr:hypothetical protein KitaXyl93_04270 [Kitasatospora sp. Xyl93]